MLCDDNDTDTYKYKYKDKDKDKMLETATYLKFVIFFTPTHFEAWKFYTQKCINSRQKFTRDKTA